MLPSLISWRKKPWLPSSLARMDEEMNQFLGEVWGENGDASMNLHPTIDLVEKETEFEATVDLPGMKPEEFEVEFRNGALCIHGERREEKEEKEDTFHRIERSHGEFRRVLPVPGPVDEESMEAEFSNGVLKIVLPKSESATSRYIKVKT